MPAAARDARSLFRGVFAVALATLLYEIALIRVLSFTIWYHFGYVVISTALLGFGASGTLLAVRPRVGAHHPMATLARAALAAGVAAALALGFVCLVPLHPLRIFEDPRQLALLIAYQLAATVPFFFSGIAVSLALREVASRVDRLYFWDLVGGGLGCALAVPLMNWLSPPGVALLAAAGFAVAAAAFGSRRRAASLALAAALVAAAPFGASLPFKPAHTKELALHVLIDGMVPDYRRWHALFRTDVVRATERTPHSVDRDWGVSRTVPDPIQPPWGFIAHDGSAGTPIHDLRAGRLDHLDDHVLKLPYLVAPAEPRVLVIGVGGGIDLIVAQRFGASHVTGVELDPVAVELLRDRYADLGDGLFTGPRVQLVVGEGRHFVRSTGRSFDLIQLTGVDTLSATAQGAYVLAENYLYTVEAVHDYLDRLEPGGVLSIATGHLRDAQPRTAGRMVRVARRALAERGVARPERHIAVIHSRRFLAEVMVKNEPFTPGHLALLRRESDRLSFRPLLLGPAGHPVFRALATARGAEQRALLDSLPYAIGAITDDSPFFFRFYRWRDALRAGEYQASHASALGQLVLAALLVSLSALGAVLVLGPLLAFRRRGLAGGPARTLGMLAYFLAVGLGFMLFEVSLIQRFVLYLGYPTYSLTVVLFSLLVSLGAGSFFSRRWVGRERRALPAALGVVALLALFYMRGLPVVQDWTLGSPLALRIAISVGVLAPLGLVLGIFFPLGIRRAEALHRDLVPWAWGINGCASVTAAVLAVVLAMSFGFTRVWLLSLVVYAAGVAALLVSDRSARSA